MKIYYAETFLDESQTCPNKKGVSQPTGKLQGMIFTRSFYFLGKKIVARRGVVSFAWKKDTAECKRRALRIATKGMKELKGLDKNPELSWIPDVVKKDLLANQ